MKSFSLWVLLALPLMSLAAEYPNCNIKKDVRITYSEKQATDSLSVSIKGMPCYEATLTIRIINKSGRPLYTYQKPFKPHVATQWDDTSLDIDAKDLVDQITRTDALKSTDQLPVWQMSDAYYEDNYQELKIDRAYYEKLRRRRWRSYTHPTSYESWKVIVFDREKLQIVEVSSGGL